MKKILSYVLIGAMCIASLTACGKKKDTGSSVEDARAFLWEMYKSTDGTASASDYELTSIITIAMTDKYTVEWTVDDTENVKIIPGETTTKIDVNEKASSEVTYTLTATVKDAKGKTATQQIKRTIPAYKEFSFADYVAAKDDTTVVVKGTITALIAKSKGNSSNCIYFEDADGGYYAYNMTQDPVTELNLKEGMTVQVTGTRSTYSGTYEITNASVEILDSNVKAATAVDLTEAYKKAENLKDATLTAKQSKLVTVKGVEITGQDTASGYYKFKLGELESYLRISSSVCPLTKDDQAAFIASHTEHKGYTADVTGLLCVYDGAFYLTPISVDAISNFKMVERTDAEKLAFEFEGLGIKTKIQEDTAIDLPATGKTYTDVAMTWSATGENAAITENKLSISQTDKDYVVTLTVAMKCGNETKTENIEIKVEAKATDLCTAAVLAKIAELAEGETISGTQVLRGKITEIKTPYDANYGNITVNMDVNGTTIQAFRLQGGEDLQVGDEITVMGVIKNYKGTIEFDAKCKYFKDLSVEETKQLMVIDKAYALAEGESMSGTQVLSGKITEIKTAYDEKYGNITVNMDVAGKTIQAFRLLGGQDLKVDDVITVTGNIKNYKGTVEFDAKCTYVMGQQLEEAKDALVMEKAYALAEGEAMSGIQELKGKITEIKTAYDEKYGNITVNMEVAGKTIQAFRLLGGQDLKVDDVITVSGIIKNYKGTVEFDAKCTYTK